MDSFIRTLADHSSFGETSGGFDVIDQQPSFEVSRRMLLACSPDSGLRSHGSGLGTGYMPGLLMSVHFHWFSSQYKTLLIGPYSSFNHGRIDANFAHSVRR